MNKTEDTENNAKVSDSAYSNSCSNSQSRKSYSSKSMHSGSNSSGSSGYGGKLSAYSHSHHFNQPQERRIKDKEGKKKMKKSVESQVTKENDVMKSPAEPAPVFEEPEKKINNVDQTPPPALVIEEQVSDNMEISTSDRGSTKDECGTRSPIATSMNYVSTRPILEHSPDGFSCVISMQDGILMYTTSSITTALGFPKDMWLGRSFIDFVHPKDRNAFASQITNGLAVPKNANGTQIKELVENHKSTMLCRIRRYRGLTSGFRIKDKMVTYMPFLLNFLFKKINDEDGQVIYLVIRATPLFSAFKTANEIILNPKPFVVRHSACGRLEYIDPDSVPYLGYLPQDIIDKDVLQLYHPDDLEYLRQVYETIVREGAVQRSKTYRMLTQNGDYLKLETEWSSFINPWSRKLEFVLGKHFIVEGPKNPDVFQASDSEKTPKITDEEQANAQTLRQNIIKIMNEVLTKPAEAAKQQMGKRCQDLATFMESLMEETPKINEELRIDIQDTNHSLYERDSVIFGGMSPHHDFNESKSSTDTPISYTQLNYNQTLQRYFDSHEPYEEYRPTLNKLELRESVEASSSICVSPMAQDSEDFSERDGDIAMKNYNKMSDYEGVRLTESLLNKHNAEMEKELVKIHRENRSGSKNEKEKVSFETSQKKKEHLARCNASFHPATEDHADTQPHGVKRASKQVEEASAHKHRCSSSRVTRHKPIAKTTSVQHTSTTTTAVGSSPWPTSSVNSMNTFILGLGIPQQMSLVNSITMPGIIPMYYTPATIQPTTGTQANNINPNTFQIQGYPNPNGTYPEMSVPHYQEHTGVRDGIAKNNPECTTTSSSLQYQPQQIPCVMFGQAVYGSPFMYSSIDPQVSYTLQQSFVPQNITNVHALDNSNKNSEEARRLTLLPKAGKSFSYLTRKREESGGNKKEAYDVSNSSADVSMRSTEAIVENRNKRQARLGNSDGTNDKTDEESSYSSFYSSFFKTDSGSNEESDTKNIVNRDDVKYWQNNPQNADTMSFQSSDAANVSSNSAHNEVPRRKIDPPWMEQVRVTSELVYKYQIINENVDDVLTCDKEKLQKYEQPSLVNEQLEQLYLDLQLEGVAARLTLEEGITSSSSSGEESFVIAKSKSRRRKREYSKLVMIYEEDAPLPPPDKDANSL
ncbi:unnamed protein product [Euphydryas editha]|uniref:Period circadian protein n=1 Tax=Euphydryas editha TaxID=104508 RepID=A0AAU9UX90_EUPED|nr:unnamed protein product [Euphydryas editha]